MEDTRLVRERNGIGHRRRRIGSCAKLALIRLFIPFARNLHVQCLRDVATDVTGQHDVTHISLPPVEL